MNKIHLTPQEVHNTKEFIKFFDKIPEEQWCTGTTTQWTPDIVQHCAGGHILSYNFNSNPDNNTYQLKTLDQLFKKLTGIEAEVSHTVNINDNSQNKAIKYGNTPKERILNALKSLLTEE